MWKLGGGKHLRIKVIWGKTLEGPFTWAKTKRVGSLWKQGYFLGGPGKKGRVGFEFGRVWKIHNLGC